jgi:hypothetical protein
LAPTGCGLPLFLIRVPRRHRAPPQADASPCRVRRSRLPGRCTRAAEAPSAAVAALPLVVVIAVNLVVSLVVLPRAFPD